MTYDDALGNFFELPELSVIDAIDALIAQGYDPHTAYLGVIDLCWHGSLGQKADADLSSNVTLYGVTAAAMIRDIAATLPTPAP